MLNRARLNSMIGENWLMEKLEFFKTFSKFFGKGQEQGPKLKRSTATNDPRSPAGLDSEQMEFPLSQKSSECRSEKE